jgi:sugar phosphate isomerase/epimerase
MKYGICGTVEKAGFFTDCGLDFIEYAVPDLLKPSDGEDAFHKSLEKAIAAKLPFPVLNCFVPADLKITGNEVNKKALEIYVESVCKRAKEAGVEIIVFGSGIARKVPDNFPKAKATNQLICFCRMSAPIAQGYKITIAVEPLNSKECNILNTIRECASLVKTVNHPSIRLLIDGYHLLMENDCYEDIVINKKLIAHTHIATAPNRLPPAAEECNLQQFFKALKNASYNGCISIEGKISENKNEIIKAIEFMRQLRDES